MRATRTRAATATRFAVGAVVLVSPATALAVGNAGAQPAQTPVPAQGLPLHAHAPSRVAYEALTQVHGRVPAADAGTPVALEYRPAGTRAWRTVASTMVGPRGGYRLRAHLGRSGALQVIPRGQAPAFGTQRASVSNGTASPAVNSNLDRRLTPGPVQLISVSPQLALSRPVVDAILGQRAQIAGRLLPGRPGRRVELELHEGRGWRAIAGAHTNRSGRFSIGFSPSASGEVVRVAFAGDRVNAHAHSGTSTVSAMQYAEVSWYNDAGSTACGFHATYGIASRTLPCGSHVALSYGGRTIDTTVDDRGPFVYSRLYDLNQNVAAALGISGVATVLASV